MFKILKWAVLGCIGIAAVNVFTDGRLEEKVRASIERMESSSEHVSLKRKIDRAKRHLERSEEDFTKLYQSIVAERETLQEIGEEIAALENQQHQLLGRAEYLDARLGTEQTSYRELTGIYSRTEVAEQARASWRSMELNEEMLQRKRQLRSAQQERVASAEQAISSHLDRQHQARLELVRAETKLAELQRDARWSAVPGQGDEHLDKAEREARKIRQQLKVYEQTLHLNPAHGIGAPVKVGPEADAFRREMTARYGEVSDDA